MNIYLSLGANLGNRGETLREALRQIACLPQTALKAVAPFYETAPWGNLGQFGAACIYQYGGDGGNGTVAAELFA